MNFGALSEKDSPIHRRDPRARIAACLAFIALAVWAQGLWTLGAALALSCVSVRLAGLGLRELLPRLCALNLFVLILGATMPGRDGLIALYGGFQDGAPERFLALALRCDAILLAATALLATIDTAAFGHALAHFRVPDKLAHLFLLTIGQTESLAREQARLREAMRARAFHPKNDLHTCKSLGNLASMSLVRAFERAEKLSESMRCRNFQGRFHLLRHFKMERADWGFLAVCAAALAACAALELL
jgi:cobalt/nickel transport system permease protein